MSVNYTEEQVSLMIEQYENEPTRAMFLSSSLLQIEWFVLFLCACKEGAIESTLLEVVMMMW